MRFSMIPGSLSKGRPYTESVMPGLTLLTGDRLALAVLAQSPVYAGVPVFVIGPVAGAPYYVN